MRKKKAAAFVDGYLSALLAQASHVIASEFHRVVADNGMSVSEWRILATLAGNAPMKVGRLANICLLKNPTVTRILDRMQASGWVRREPSAQDRRAIVVSITPAGEAKAAHLIALAQQHERRVLKPFGLERAEDLKATLKAIIGGR